MKLWGGRFSKGTAKTVDEFGASIGFDQKLYKEDIAGSRAHAKMLAKIDVLSDEDLDAILTALDEIESSIEKGNISFMEEFEDIHMNIESLLTERIGYPGKKIHTARSRNDQVAVDIRLYLKTRIEEICGLIEELLKTIILMSENNIDVILPGFTHLQHAQPVRLSFHLMAYFEMFKRDHQRLTDCLDRMDVLPLGSGALSGTTYPTDRVFLAKELGFAKVSLNALDSVSDRDYLIEFQSDASILMMHFSRFCEELIIWNTSEFGFVEMDDAYSTGSSIMPQKKNPDVAELIRGKTGRVYGNLMGILTVMKSLPLAYNKDMQEDKEGLFDTVETLKSVIPIFNEMLATLTFNAGNMMQATKMGFLNATDIADYLVKKGLPFRSAHEIVGRMVLYCTKRNCNIEDMRLSELKSFHEDIQEDLLEIARIEKCTDAKISAGGTSKENVMRMIEENKKFLQLLA
ncbi:MAG: argininosuccinate lyase [Clostridiales bacterium]|nr:MAG: argininosuccinate lyase [Clostridiales bacterium]